MPPKRSSLGSGASSAAGQEKEAAGPGEQASAGARNDIPASSTAGSPNAESKARAPPSTGRGGKPTITPRPKFTARRSQAARKEAEQAEARKRAAEAEAAAAEAKRKAQEARKYGYNVRADRGSRGSRGGRGRGGHMGDSIRQREESVPSGPFSAGKTYSEATSRRSGWAAGNVGGGLGTFGGAGGPGTGVLKYGGGTGIVNTQWSATGAPNVKSEQGPGVSFAAIKSEDGGYISSDDEDAERKGPKQNIDQMQVIDLTGEHDPDESHLLAPIRLLRVPHKARTIGMAADGSDDSNEEEKHVISDKRKGKQRAKEIEVTGAMERHTRPAAYSSSDTEAEPAIKEEPMDDEQRMHLLTPEHQDAARTDLGQADPPKDLPSSPESKRKSKAKVKETAHATVDEDDFPIPPKPKFETESDEIEWHRKFLDMKLLRDELGSLVPRSAQQSLSGIDSAGDIAMSDGTSATEQAKVRQGIREQATYLFQFPPVLPGLHPVTVKTDPERRDLEDANDDAMDVDGTEATTAKESVVALDKKVENEIYPSHPKLPAGAVGKLRIHKSGRATLDWGGTSLSLSMGADATFLQNVMMTRMPENKPADENSATTADQEPAHAMGMGQIRGKFVITPDWEEILK